MSILDINMEIPEQSPVDEGEYELVITSAEIKKQDPNKGTSDYLRVRFEVMGEPDAKDLSHVFMLPNNDGSVSTRDNNNRHRALKQFVLAAQISPSFLHSPEECVGATVKALLSLKDGGQYGTQNKVVSFVA